MKTCAWCIEELSKSVDGIEVDDDGNEVCPECYSGYEAQSLNCRERQGCGLCNVLRRS